MADFEAEKPLREFDEWQTLHLSECLEERRIRHCLAGDAILTAMGHPLVISRLYLAVADEQLEDAVAVLLQQGLQRAQGPALYVNKDATINPLDFPGYHLRWPRASPLDSRVSLIPSSFWHMDLSEASLSNNTFLHPKTQCRFPKRLVYLDALIDAIVDSTLNPGHNCEIRSYFIMQYYYLSDWLSYHSPDTLLELPPCNKFFIDLYGSPIGPGIRRSVCVNRRRIKKGQLTLEDAMGKMPMKLIERRKAIEELRLARMRAEAATKAEVG